MKRLSLLLIVFVFALQSTPLSRALSLSVTPAFAQVTVSDDELEVDDSAPASIYDGPGIEGGLEAAAAAGVSSETDFGAVLGAIVDTALSYVSLLAVAVIIIAGLFLILGLGSDDSRERAKKIVLYVAIGLLLIILSKALVELVKSFGT